MLFIHSPQTLLINIRERTWVPRHRQFLGGNGSLCNKFELIGISEELQAVNVCPLPNFVLKNSSCPQLTGYMLIIIYR